MPDMPDTQPIDPDLLEVGEDDDPENARRIMQAGLRLFAQKGYAATSVREIVRTADVTNPMLYYYFDSKEGLFVALIEYFFDDLNNRVERVLDEHDEFESLVEELIWTHMDGCLDSPVGLQFVYFVLFGPTESKPSYDVMGAREQMLDKLHTRFVQAQQNGEFELPDVYTTEMAVERLLGLINQQMIRALKQSEDHPDADDRAEAMGEFLNRQTCRELTDFYFRGLGTQ